VARLLHHPRNNRKLKPTLAAGSPVAWKTLGYAAWAHLGGGVELLATCSASSITDQGGSLRCLKRRLSDAVYRCLLAEQHDQRRPTVASG